MYLQYIQYIYIYLCNCTCDIVCVSVRGILTHLHVLRCEASEGLQEVVDLVPLQPLLPLLLLEGLTPRPNVADQLLYLAV